MRRGLKIALGLGATALLGVGIVYIYKQYKIERHADANAITYEDILKEKTEAKEAPVNGASEVPIEVVHVLDEAGNELPIRGGKVVMRRGTDPDSRSAHEQYINMMVAEFKDNPEFSRTLGVLFRHDYIGRNDDDRRLWTNLMTRRSSFFGTSKWNKHVSWADVILYYGEQVAYNRNDDMTYWVEQILDQVQVDDRTPTAYLTSLFEDLLNHEFHNQQTGGFGLFGLDETSVAYMEEMSLRNPERGIITFDMELNAFLGQLSREDEANRS